VGEDQPRTVVSGLVDFMPSSALTNRRAVLLCNLKPAKMRGIESQAMVLAASDPEHTKVELLSPPPACAVGERIFFEGHPGDPLPPNQIAKKKVWEAVQPDLSTSGERVALYKDLPFNTKHGVCTVETVAGGKIK
jgi:methionyl-tRNA synthetase